MPALAPSAQPWARHCFALLAVLVTTLAACLPAAAAEPRTVRLVTDGPYASDENDGATLRAESEDGSRVVFSTAETMAASDTDSVVDLYLRVGTDAPIHLTDSPNGADEPTPAHFVGASADAGYVYFFTTEKLVGTDTDGAADIYARTPAGALVHVSDRPVGPDGPHDATFSHVTPDGARAYFHTTESLAPSDTDFDFDVYEFGPGGLRHISEDPFGVDQSYGAFFRHASSDGARVYFSTSQSLGMSDTDAVEDVYVRLANGALAHVSDDPAEPDQALAAYFVGETRGGDRVWFETKERLAASDTDAAYDAYERLPGGALTHVSDDPIAPDAEENAELVGWSADGGRLVFESREAMVASDTDTARDVYLRTAAGSLVHISDDPTAADDSMSATFRAISPDGGRTFFTTSESLAASDDDAARDIYERAPGGPPVHLSDDPTGADDPADADFETISSDGSRVLFSTRESLAAGDTDEVADLYLRADGETAHLSDNPSGPDGAIPAYSSLWSSDLARVYFSTLERLVGEDTDAAEDAYLSLPAPPPPGGADVPRPTDADDATPPRLTRLRVAPDELKAGAALPRLLPRRPGGKRAGAEIRFRLSEPASVRFTVRRGRRAVGTFALKARAGANRVAFGGRLNRKRRLPPGRYRLIARPRDAAGNAGSARGTGFRLLSTPAPERSSR